jgi:hypothetical protein
MGKECRRKQDTLDAGAGIEDFRILGRAFDTPIGRAERANGDLPTPLREQAVAVPQMLIGMVEDEALVAMAIKDMLTKLGFEVLPSSLIRTSTPPSSTSISAAS